MKESRTVVRKEHPEAKESTENIVPKKPKKQSITENQTAEDIDLVENEKIQKETKKTWNKVIYKKKQTPGIDLKETKKKENSNNLKTLDPDKFLFVKGKVRFEELEN